MKLQVCVGLSLLLAAVAMSDTAGAQKSGGISAQKKGNSCFDLCMIMVGSGPKLSVCQSRCEAKRAMKRGTQ